MRITTLKRTITSPKTKTNDAWMWIWGWEMRLRGTGREDQEEIARKQTRYKLRTETGSRGINNIYGSSSREQRW
jgi:hypothetical protein